MMNIHESEYTKKRFKILSIGNSYSEDTQRYLYDIALHHGMDKENTIIANMFIPGASLADHVSNLLGDFSAYELQLYRTEIRQNIHNYRLSEAIKYTDWDVITFQQASHD